MSETSFQAARPAKARAEATLNATKVAHGAIGDLMTTSSASALSPLAMGCLVTLTKHACGRVNLEELGSEMQLKDAQTVLAMKGLSFGDSDLVLAALGMSGLVRIEDGVLSIPVLDGAIQSASMHLANRVAGWNKRGAPAPARPTAKLISMPLPQAAPVAAPAPVAPVAAAWPDTAPAAAPAMPVVKPARPKLAPKQTFPEDQMTYRYSADERVVTDPAVDAVVIRIELKGGRTAEITQSFVDDLQSTFGKAVDVPLQLRLAANWSKTHKSQQKTGGGLRTFLNGWMGRALRDANAMATAMRVGNQRNGFGQGGSYEAPADTNHASGTASQGDEFADLLGADSGSDVAAASEAAPTAAAPAQEAQASFDDLFSAPEVPAVQAAPAVGAAPAEPARSSLSSRVLAARAGLGLSRVVTRPTQQGQR